MYKISFDNSAMLFLLLFIDTYKNEESKWSNLKKRKRIFERCFKLIKEIVNIYFSVGSLSF